MYWYYTVPFIATTEGESEMLKNIKILLGLEKRETESQVKIITTIINNRLIIKFSRPVNQLELDRLQTLDLIQALTGKIALVNKK